ncbi:hypothetical protein HAX54_004372 [Datura stramonium]|uniref:Uncharacterized protein n=1 Tax=Datura stramonium TaxID=4076 RepID=A0ABS8WWS5_DATST|nr:hypothetical protein [Datura stramonium]
MFESTDICAEPIKKLKDHMNEEYIRSVTDLMVIKGRPKLTKSGILLSRIIGMVDLMNLILMGKPIFGGVPKAISFISFGVPVKNDKEKRYFDSYKFASTGHEKFQEVVYKMTFTNMEEFKYNFKDARLFCL